LGPLWGSILAQDSPKRSLEAPGRAFWSGKKRKGKVLFSYAKTIVSEPRADQNTRKIAKRHLEAIKRPSRNKNKRAYKKEQLLNPF
jgi:hypothetical protein